MQYAALASAPTGFITEHRVYDTVMQRIDMDLVSWNYMGFKMHLLSLSPEEQAKAVSNKQISLMRYRKLIVQLEQSLATREQQDARDMMQAGSDIEALTRMEQDLQSL